MKNKSKIQIEKLDDVDVFVDPTPLTQEQKAFLSEAIRRLKVEAGGRKKRKKVA